MKPLIDIEDAATLRQYLIDAGRLRPEEQASFRRLPGGVSSRTVWVDHSGGDPWVLKQSLPKLRVEMDWFSDPARVHREALALRWLGRLAPGHMPQFVFEDFQHHILAMTAVPLPHQNWKAMLLDGELLPQHVEQFAWLLGTIHREGVRLRHEVEPLFADRSYFESLRIEPYYACTAERVPAARPFLSRLIETTRARGLTLVHGDYSPKNVLVASGQLMLLDHEVTHFGDPAFDVGFALTHFLSKAHHLPVHRQTFTRGAGLFWETYAHVLSELAVEWDLERLSVRHTLGCLLARVWGRSPLEYLTGAERDRQSTAAVDLMDNPPEGVVALVHQFVTRC